MYHHENLKSVNTFSILGGLFDSLSGLLILYTHCNTILFTQNILLCLLFLQIHLFDILCLLCLISKNPCWSAHFPFLLILAYGYFFFVSVLVWWKTDYLTYKMICKKSLGFKIKWIFPNRISASIYQRL